MEDIGKIIINGFETYTRNLNLSIPFVLNFILVSILGAIMFMIGFFYILELPVSFLEELQNPENLLSILPLIGQNYLYLALLAIIYFLIAIFMLAFFTAGAIGMAKQATEAGKSELSVLVEAGKKNVISLCLAYFLLGLIYLAGIIFIVPGAMKNNLSDISFQENPGAGLLLLGGFVIWLLYIIILSIMLAVFEYSLVIENSGPVDGLLTGFRFFMKQKLDVFMLLVIILVLASVIGMITGQVLEFIPVPQYLRFLFEGLVNALTITPLVTIWFVRLYMTRTGKKIYFNELLAHPNDLAKGNQ